MMQNNGITTMAGTEMLVPSATVGTQPAVNTSTPMGIGGETLVSLFATANSNVTEKAIYQKTNQHSFLL